MFALFASVLIAVLAIIVDLGVATAQLRGLQNAADAGAMAGARVMAASVAKDASNNTVYVSLTNLVVQDRVDALIAPNRLVSSPTFTYARAIQFRDCAGASLGFTASSDPGVVTALGGALLERVAESLMVSSSWWDEGVLGGSARAGDSCGRGGSAA
jgi:uncharacterized membrane protein